MKNLLEKQNHKPITVEALNQQKDWPYGRKFKCRHCKRISPFLVGKEQLDYWKLHHADVPYNINFRKNKNE